MKTILLFILLCLSLQAKMKQTNNVLPQLLTTNLRSRSGSKVSSIEELFGITSNGKGNNFNVINVLNYDGNGKVTYLAESWEKPLDMNRDLFAQTITSNEEAQLEIWKRFYKADKTVLLSAFSEDKEDLFVKDASKVCSDLGTYSRNANFDGVNLDFYQEVNNPIKVDWIEKCVVEVRKILPASQYVISFSLLAEEVLRDGPLLKNNFLQSIDLFSVKLFGNSQPFTTYDLIFKTLLRKLILDSSVDPSKIILQFDPTSTSEEFIESSKLKTMFETAVQDGFVLRGVGSSLLKKDPYSSYANVAADILKGKLIFADKIGRKTSTSKTFKLTFDLKNETFLRSKFIEGSLSKIANLFLDTAMLEKNSLELVNNLDKRKKRVAELRDISKDIRIFSNLTVKSVEKIEDNKKLIDYLSRSQKEQLYDGINLKILDSNMYENNWDRVNFLIELVKKHMSKDQTLAITCFAKVCLKDLPKVDLIALITERNEDLKDIEQLTITERNKIHIVVLDEPVHKQKEGEKVSLPDFELRTYEELGKKTGIEETEWNAFPSIKKVNDEILFDNIESFKRKLKITDSRLYVLIDKFSDFEFFIDLMDK